MKNPFEYPLSYIVINHTLNVCRLVYDHPNGASLLLTKAQAEYAARAINQHEKLVAMLQRLEFAGLDVDSEEECVCCVCGAMNWPKPQHTPACPLAALLAEEKGEEG